MSNEPERRKAGRPKLPEQKCLTPNCEGKFAGDQPRNERGARGLCKTCATAAGLLIKRKVTTWEELEELGLSQPTYKSLIERALYEARKKRDSERKE